MLALGVGETITDGERTYQLGEDLNLHFISLGGHAQHHVTKDVMKILLKIHTDQAFEDGKKLGEILNKQNK